MGFLYAIEENVEGEFGGARGRRLYSRPHPRRERESELPASQPLLTAPEISQAKLPGCQESNPPVSLHITLIDTAQE